MTVQFRSDVMLFKLIREVISIELARDGGPSVGFSITKLKENKVIFLSGIFVRLGQHKRS